MENAEVHGLVLVNDAVAKAGGPGEFPREGLRKRTQLSEREESVEVRLRRLPAGLEDEVVVHVHGRVYGELDIAFGEPEVAGGRPELGKPGPEEGLHLLEARCDLSELLREKSPVHPAFRSR